MNKEYIPLGNLTNNVSHLTKRMGQNFSRGYINTTIMQKNKILEILSNADLTKKNTLQNFFAYSENNKSDPFNISYRGNKMYLNKKKRFEWLWFE